ncbi:MAG: DUF4386 domain-containing protein [Gammaproteobacteria bacterium]
MPLIAKARLAGWLYLLVIAGGLFAELGVRQQLINAGDSHATALNILANENLYRLGMSINLAYLLCNIPFAVLFYEIFRATNRLVAIMILVGIAITTTIEAANLFNLLDALEHLTGPFYASLSLTDRYDLAYASLQNFSSGFAISLVFFGAVCLLYARAIFESNLIPRLIGALIALTGVCYIFNSFAMFLAPDLAASLFPYVMLPCFVGELTLALWLSIKGIRDKAE